MTSVMPAQGSYYQLSLEATQLGVGQFVELINFVLVKDDICILYE